MGHEEEEEEEEEAVPSSAPLRPATSVIDLRNSMRSRRNRPPARIGDWINTRGLDRR